MSYSSEVLADSPLAYFRLDETSGTTMADSSGNARDGSYFNSPNLGATGLITGAGEKGVDFAGGADFTLGDYATTPTGSWLDTTSVTVEAWIRPDTLSPGGSGLMDIVARDHGNTTDGRMWILRTASAKVEWVFWLAASQGTERKVVSTTSLVAGTTYHVVGTYDGTTARLFINGTQEATLAASGALRANTAKLAAVARETFAAQRHFDGVIDEVALYGAALSSGRVSAHYAAGTTTPSSTVTLGGTLRATTAAFAMGTVAAVTLAGVAQPPSAAFAIDVADAQIDAALAGEVQSPTAAFEVLTGASVDLAGMTQRETGAFSVAAVAMADREVSFAGSVSRPDAAFEATALASVAIAGTVLSPVAQFVTYVVAPVVDVPILAAGHAVVVAQAFGAQSLVNGTQPVYTISQAEIPRATTRILMGNKDVTYWRNTLTPLPKYTLVEPLLYGPATIDFPQVAACFGDEPGQGDLWFMHPGAVVEVQRVVDGVVVGTDYKGVVTDYDIAGRDLTVNIGGELQGRAELVNRQPVIFPRINDLGHQIADAVRDLGLPHFPPLGAVTGIETMTVGGTGHLEHLQDLITKAHTRSGNQWTTMPDPATGVYETHRKDTTTIHGTVFLDDARTVANLRRDISEEPNRIFVTCVTPQGQRVCFGVYPGLIQGPVPDFPGRMVIGDTGDGVRLLIGKLHATGYLKLKDVAGGFDQDVSFAVLALQADAGLDEDGEVNEATWNALYDLDVTGQSLEWATVQPAAQRRKVRKFNRSASGTILALNPDYEPETLVRDRNIDLGAGVTRDQAREFARTVLHDSDNPNWTGTITFQFGALIRGDGYEGMTVTPADVMDAREIKPGMNLDLPQFAGGILVHVSAVEVSNDGIVTATVDTRARDALEVWEVIARNRETRNDPSRSRSRKHRSSTIVKDSIGEWDEIGGLLGQDVTLMAGWNTFKVVAAAEGTIARIRIELSAPHEFACAVFGDDVDRGFLDDTVGDPLTDAGQKTWRRRATRQALKEHLILYSAGTPDEPCGYGQDLKTDSAELTGVHDEEAGFGYESRDRTYLTVAVFVCPAAEGAKVQMGRVMWPRLEAGV